ncbi:T9SS type B sorting domain-containing protein [Polaribacter sp. BAL334]|uniref:T9SS type B sorting domain-containing protein n=1 Tax=Polaribacter sp. BAL334 TaxID=1708178 RepID=UPI0018D26349|nr:T9SS type B sorting domain-containing protein [Polaribacter sp. BAL334]MBG7611113.1 T9SS type B sorting domain-containing protein [Polaribacter sp. BAL334]
MFKTYFRFLSLLAFIFFAQFSSAQLSKKHFIPPLTSGDDFGEQYIYISTPKTTNVSYKITAIGRPDLSEYSGFLSNSNPIVQIILDENGNPDLDNDTQLHINRTNLNGNKITNKGLIIEASDLVYVSIRVNSSNQNAAGPIHGGALVSKGASALGTEFRVGGLVNEPLVPFSHTTFASIMATENNTLIDLSDLPNGTLFPSGVTIPANINLNEGESYIIALGGNEDPGKLIGKLIKSDKPIVVNSGSASGSFADNPSTGGTTQDYGFDQIVGADKIGSEYILVRGNGLNSFENVLLIAHFDNTEVKINGSNVTTINKGQYYVAEGNLFSSLGNMYVETTKDVFVYQGIGGSTSKANQGLFFVPPLSCENKGDVDNIASIDRIGNFTLSGGVTIVTNKGAAITINDQNISSFNSQGPFDVTGNSNYVTYTVTGLTGNVKVNSDQELYCAYFNRNGAATTGAFYSGFPSAPEINFETTVSTLGSCIPNVTLEAANTDLFDSFKWYYFNENTSDWEERSSNANYKPLESEPGKYKLIGTADCTGATFESVEITVSICPDDFDGDLIIDNLDIDLDNDGISNCDESLGNATMNLSDIENPFIIFQDSSTNNTITSSNITKTEATNSIIGDTSGNFVSTVNPANNSNSVFELNFNQNINFLFRQSNLDSHTINDGEFFIVRVSPNNKNITLLDPDDQLLIDTNFDGEFESNTRFFSSSEIRFKYKSNTAGSATTFQFFANQVNQFVFEHQSSGISSSTIFRGNIQLTCFGKDSDGDGIEDMFDVDSDNDGIPDVFESSSPKITLSGVDANEDGLDDVFNGITTGIDTDNDGFPNHLDVDSDNDGIFDLVEAGHNGIDANNDGILDNAIVANVGSNGLLNSLETAADTKILALNYTIFDTDADDIFNFLELDSDNDECFDVIEAGFTDNGSGILLATPFGVDANGKVTNNADGYTAPNANYITAAPIVIITPFENVTFCENNSDVITIDSNADQFQWEVSTDNGVNWNPITDNAIYAGATTKDLQITNTPISFKNYQYRVLLSRTGNSCVQKPSNSIILDVNPEPVTQDEVFLLQCDDDLDRISTINLTEAEISISANYQNETFTYFATQADAIAGSPEVADKLRYPVNQIGEAWVRTISSDGCYRISKINLQVEAAADVAYNKEFDAICDDFLQADGTSGPLNDDTDGITNFDFSIATSEILAFFPTALQPDLEVSYYETSADRTAVINKIIDISNYRNTNYPSDITRQTIYFKITNKNNNDCSGTGELYLKTNTVPVANAVADLELCDDANDGDGTNGIVQNFDLESQTATILGSQNPADFTVTYHLSLADSETGNNPQTTPFANTTRDLQTIFIRVTNNTTGCFTNHTRFNLIVNPLPIANFVADLEVCDDNSDGSARNGFSQIIDLESQTAGILGTQDASIYTVTYHRSLADAQIGNNPLISPYSSTTPNRETIFVRVYNANTQCANGISNFDVIVNPEPIFQVPTNLAYCDNLDDGDDTNSVIQTIDLDSKITEILGTTQSPTDFTVTFHSSQANATLGNAPISSPYTNTNATETIFVRIQNRRTGCVNDDAFFDVIVNPLPSFGVSSPQILCLNDLPLNIAAENPMDVYTYEWTNESGTVLGTFDNLNVTSGGKYFVTATSTNGTLCSRTAMIEVNESNIAVLENSFVTIIDESTNIGSQNNLSISIDTISNDLGPGEYQFAIVNTDTNERFPFAGFQDEPLFENLEGGIYQIIVNDKNGCSPDATLLVSVIQFPKFFTPNGDGENDTWVVKGANRTFYPNASINIFNRYGKLVAQVPIDSQGWNGTYNGTLLPSDDYWYNITLIPADTTKPTINKKGNFSLLRK